MSFLIAGLCRSTMVDTVPCGLSGHDMDRIVRLIGRYLSRGRLSEGPAFILVASQSTNRSIAEATSPVNDWRGVRNEEQSPYSHAPADNIRNLHILQDWNYAVNKCRYPQFERTTRSESSQRMNLLAVCHIMAPWSILWLDCLDGWLPHPYSRNSYEHRIQRSSCTVPISGPGG